jgi:hypothetical protein
VHEALADFAVVHSWQKAQAGDLKGRSVSLGKASNTCMTGRQHYLGKILLQCTTPSLVAEQAGMLSGGTVTRGKSPE